jgi:soluble lytic murein transglycosylase-like protein
LHAERLMPVPFLACMLAVSVQLQLPPRVLPAIQAVEGGRIGMARLNTNGTEDLGLMQVNSTWVDVLARRLNQPRDGLREQMVQDACFNIAVAGAIVKLYLRETRGDLLSAIGNYHSRTLSRHRAYQGKVVAAAVKMFAPPTWRARPGAAGSTGPADTPKPTAENRTDKNASSRP